MGLGQVIYRVWSTEVSGEALAYMTISAQLLDKVYHQALRSHFEAV